MNSRLSRRALIKTVAGSALLAGIGVPAIVKAQADAIIRQGEIAAAKKLEAERVRAEARQRGRERKRKRKR